MNSHELWQAGKLGEAIKSLALEIRDYPVDSRRRTFLFELLCFAGEFERAAKHLDVLAQASPDAEVGALVYRSALSAERKRQALFDAGQFPETREAAPRAGVLNGKPFRTFEDLDPRIGARFEIFVAGEYVWLPIEHVGGIRLEAPRFLRDTLWATAVVQTGPSFHGQEFGEVLMPVLCPSSWRHEDDGVKLGRATDWKNLEGQGEVPFGQKLFLVDEEEVVPFLQIRELTFAAAETPQPTEPPPESTAAGS